MDDTILRMLKTVIRQAEILRILFQGIHLILGYRVLDRLILVQCRDIVVRHTSDLRGTEGLQSTCT